MFYTEDVTLTIVSTKYNEISHAQTSMYKRKLKTEMTAKDNEQNTVVVPGVKFWAFPADPAFVERRTMANIVFGMVEVWVALAAAPAALISRTPEV